MRIGRAVAFLSSTGVSLGAVVASEGRSSLVAKVPGSGKFVRLVFGEAFKVDSCSQGGDIGNLVRKTTGVSLNQLPVDLTEETVYLPSGDVYSEPVIDLTDLDDEAVFKTLKPANQFRSLAAFNREFGAPTVAQAVKQIRHKKGFTALPLEYKAQLKKFI